MVFPKRSRSFEARVWKKAAWGFLLSSSLTGAACTPEGPGECGEDSDCPAGSSCLDDTARGFTICSLDDCRGDFDCPPTQSCVALSEDPQPNSPGDRNQCVESVRVCWTSESSAPREPCDGLDNDCNGSIDDDCTPLACTREDACGAFSCIPAPGAERAECAEPVVRRPFFGRNESNLNLTGVPCTDGAQCANGMCNGGFCAPVCRDGEIERFCPESFIVEGRGLPLACAEQVLPDRPSHSACQVFCGRSGSLGSGPGGPVLPSECPSGTQCAWRRNLPSEAFHVGACTELDPSRLDLGEACSPSLRPEGDIQCQHGLCFDGSCTRLCDGFGADCSDVGPNHSCTPRDFTYRDRLSGQEVEYIDLFICVEMT